MDNVITLLSKTYQEDEIGQQKSTVTRLDVFGIVTSISQNEYFKALSEGFKASRKAVIWSFEYNGENEVEIDGEKYSIYRTFKNGDKMELYLEVRLGNG